MKLLKKIKLAKTFLKESGTWPNYLMELRFQPFPL